MSYFPMLDGAEAWMEFGREDNAAWQLMIALPAKTGKQKKAGFWLEVSPPGGGLIGWMRFSFVTALREQVVFAGTEWRQAHGQAPVPPGVW